MGNSLIFQVPTKSYTSTTYQQIIVNIPNRTGYMIPCIYIAPDPNSQHLFICFHGNAEDNGIYFTTAYKLHEKFQADVLMVEYPGYGIYPGEPSEDKIYSDAECVLDFMTHPYNLRKCYRKENIVLIGRSLGTAPCVHLAAQNYGLGGIVLMSPFTCIQEVAEIQMPYMGMFARFLGTQLANEKKIPKVTCPILFLHGVKDTIVPYQHSERLHAACPSPYKLLRLIPNVSHNDLNVDTDIVANCYDFFGAFMPSIMINIKSKARPQHPVSATHPVLKASNTVEYNSIGRTVEKEYPPVKFMSTGYGVGPTTSLQKSHSVDQGYPPISQEYIPSRTKPTIMPSEGLGQTYSQMPPPPQEYYSNDQYNQPSGPQANGINVKYYSTYRPNAMEASEPRIKSLFYC